MLTTSDQDYVKAIYKLQQENDIVSTTSLAASLGITPASVSGMLRKLSRAKMLVHRPYKGVRLTEKGRRAALQVVRRHRLIELFLVETLGLPWDDVHEEAERLEHAISDDVLDRIDVLLGHPDSDPHGAPIPSPTGDIADRNTTRLADLEVGQRGKVCEVSDDDSSLLRHLAEIGLTPGSSVRVDARFSFDGTLEVTVGREQHHVSAAVASSVRIIRSEKVQRS